MPHDIRDEVMDFVNQWQQKTEFKQEFFIKALAIGRSKFFNWYKRYGKINEHNARIPRDWWLEAGRKTGLSSTTWRIDSKVTGT